MQPSRPNDECVTLGSPATASSRSLISSASAGRPRDFRLRWRHRQKGMSVVTGHCSRLRTGSGRKPGVPASAPKPAQECPSRMTAGRGDSRGGPETEEGPGHHQASARPGGPLPGPGQQAAGEAVRPQGRRRAIRGNHGADIGRGSYVDPTLGRLTFARFVEEHYRPTMVNPEATTRARDESYLRAQRRTDDGKGRALTPATTPG